MNSVLLHSTINEMWDNLLTKRGLELSIRILIELNDVVSTEQLI